MNDEGATNEHEHDEFDERAVRNSHRSPFNDRGEVEYPTHQAVHDPVCHRDLQANEAASSVERGGYTYYFCSDTCRAEFDGNPDRVIEAETAYTHRPPAPPAREVPRPIV